MSKKRIVNKLRKNAYWYPLITLLDDVLDDYQVMCPGKGHPWINCTKSGRTIRLPVPCTPSDGGSIEYTLKLAKRKLRELGIE